MKVSVIVPNYNHARYLKQRIDSILNQTYQDFELIILDDCSADDSRTMIDEYISRFPNIVCYYNNSNSGSPFKQWDLGVTKSKGKYIWIAESDDFAELNFLEKTTKILDHYPSAGLVHCNSKAIDEQKKTEYLLKLKTRFRRRKWMHNYFNHGKDEISDCLFLNNMINNVSGVLFRKDKYMEAGCADYSMKYCGDWFLYIRILLISDVAYIAEPLSTYRLHSDSTFHHYFRKNTYCYEIFKIYTFILGKIHLSAGKKILMTKNIFAIISRRIIYGVILKKRKVKLISTLPSDPSSTAI
jgi:glycosyltransferase involved in cell wall biosynthesis